MTDVEGVPLMNPYRTTGANNNFNDTNFLPGRHPIVIMKRLTYSGISLYGLIQFFNIYNVILKSPHIGHEWFKIGLASSVGTSY